MVQLSEHIKQVGSTAVKIKFAQDLVVAVNVVIVAESQDVTP
jgi:ribosomal protein L9